MRKLASGLIAALVFILLVSCFASPAAQAETAVQDMGMTPDEFRERFNSKSKEIGADIQIGSLTKSGFDETSTYQYELVPGVGIVLHAVNKTGKLCRASLSYTPIQAVGYNSESIHTYIAGIAALMIAATSPDNDLRRANKVFEGLGITLENADVLNRSLDTQIDDTHYGIVATTDGMTFYIERVQHPVAESGKSRSSVLNGITPSSDSVLSGLSFFIIGLILFVICVPPLAFALRYQYSLRTKTAVILSSVLICAILASVAMLMPSTKKGNHQTESVDAGSRYDMREGVIEKGAIVAVDNDAFMELSYMISQKNVPGMMRLEREGKAFILHSPAKCRHSDALMYDGAAIVVIEEGEYALMSGLTWKTYIR